MNTPPRRQGVPAEVLDPSSGEVLGRVRVLSWSPVGSDVTAPGRYLVEVDHGDHQHQHHVPESAVNFDVDLAGETLQ